MSEEDAYPVYFFNSDTSGEKLYEEFYTDEDQIDLNLYQSLGVIKNAKKIPLTDIETCLSEIKKVMNSTNYSKERIVSIIGNFIPDFKHIETGLGLDSKM
jgi:FlaA1/EpsC-like NDP-sugar epimerase